MAKTMTGVAVFATYENEDTYVWTDANGKPVPLRSLTVLLPVGDGTVTRQKISLPDGLNAPNLTKGAIYAFPVVVGISKKKMLVTYTLRKDLAVFAAPDVE